MTKTPIDEKMDELADRLLRDALNPKALNGAMTMKERVDIFKCVANWRAQDKRLSKGEEPDEGGTFNALKGRLFNSSGETTQ